MSVLLEAHHITSNQLDGFEVTRAEFTSHPPRVHGYSPFGRYALGQTVLLETPPEVLACGEVLTNPGPLETEYVLINGELTAAQFAYFRREPTSLHLGKTTSVPYLLRRNRQGRFYLSEFHDAIPAVGEDPRVTKGVKIAGPSGRIYNGWALSTVVATPMPGNPADVKNIKQVIKWGEKLHKLETILEIEDLKNANIFPLSRLTGDENDTRLDLFGRPHPHITYTRVARLTDITKDRILSGTNITETLLPPDIHTGVNNVKPVPKHPDLRELDVHEATAPITKGGKELHYRLARYIFNISSGKVIRLGIVATRADFPYAAPKPPENGVKSYYDVVYGSMGDPRYGWMLTGVSDRYVGLAQVIRIA